MALSVKELNLEQGMPTVDAAMGWLEAELAAARKMGRPALKLIHGYGSSGRGGKIRTACRGYLREQARAGGCGWSLPARTFPFSARRPARVSAFAANCGRTGIWTGKTEA